MQVPKPLPALLAPSVTTIDISTDSRYLSSSIACFDTLPYEIQSKALLDTSKSYHHATTQAQLTEIQELRGDLIKLNHKYIQQMERAQIAQQARLQTEAELEDLSIKLFEQANGMVSEEKRKRVDAEKRAIQLENTLTYVVQELMQLKEFRSRFEIRTIEDEVMLKHTKSSFIAPSGSAARKMPNRLDDLCMDNRPIASLEDFLTWRPTAPIESLHKLIFGNYLLKRKSNKFGFNRKYIKLTTSFSDLLKYRFDKEKNKKKCQYSTLAA
ncbi:hypothetical protein A0J61_00646 [Choanephora cucurbitarum]|uniref:GDP/GTP exchange factor Sec2 N-terminal domain-containing protein n=1 Tax=Choanephora cucurbitarum TaxID=101091 RepID=A0A1C7NQC7_9FUNG|nr:hypothetical protein A0J61_00646 [Choanephora cucurbitarum]